MKILTYLLLFLLIFSLLPANPVQGTGSSEAVVYSPEGMEYQQGSLVRLSYAVFDPLQGEPDIPAGLRTQEQGIYLVQLQGPTTQASYDSLAALGIIHGYLPDHTYIVSSDHEEEIRELSQVRWVGNYHPAYRLHPDFQGPNSGGLNSVKADVQLFWEFRCDAASRERMEALGADIIDEGLVNSVVTVFAEMEIVQQIAHLPQVEWIAPVGEPQVLMDNIRIYTGAEDLHGLEIPFNGENVVGEVKDNGIDQDHLEFEGQLIGIDGNPPEESHGTSTFGIVFARGVVERAKGMSPGSGGVFCDWTVGRYQSINNLVANWDGVYQSNSWYSGATDGTYSQFSMENDRAILDFDVSMLYATGNGGASSSCSQDSVAKNIIAVGGIRHADNADWEDDRHTGGQGNRGPAADGRVKPDLCGPYESIYTTRPGSYTSSFGGTSGATPVNAGGVSLLYQMYEANHFGNNPMNTRPHASTVKALAIANAHQYELDKVERFAQGWGHLDVGAAYTTGKSHFIVDEGMNLQFGESQSFGIQADTDRPFKISLVWTDVPGAGSASKALVNDLDLIATSPSGTVYHGNFGLDTSLWTLPDGVKDDLNNVENVFIENPEEGEWQIEVAAALIAMDGDAATPALDQPFSLVVSGIYREKYDLTVLELFEADYYEPGIEAKIGGTIANLGSREAEDVHVQLLVNGSVVDEEELGNIEIEGMAEATLHWTPKTEGPRRLTLRAVPLAGENFVHDNELNASISVFYPRGRILVDMVHGRDVPRLYAQALGEERYQLIRSTEIISESSLEDRTGIIIIEPDEEYSSEELDVVRDFVESGGGLLAIGGDDDVIMGDLTSFAGIDWDVADGGSGETDEVEGHEISVGVDSLLFETSDISIVSSNPSVPVVRDEDATQPHILVAAADFGKGHVVAISDISCLDDDHLFENQNRILGVNAGRWINNDIPELEIVSPLEEEIFSSKDSIQFTALVDDPDSDSLDYHWTSNRDGTLSERESFQIRLSPGIHDIRLSVKDELSQLQRAFTLIVNETPDLELTSPENEAYLEEGSVTLEWSASDHEDDPLSFTVELVSPEETLLFEELVDAWIRLDDLEKGTLYRWRVAAEDDYQRVVWSPRWSFRYGNAPPVVELLGLEDDARISPDGVQLQWSGSDQDNDSLNYHLYLKEKDQKLVYQGDQTAHLIEDLQEGEEYLWWVEADDGYETRISEKRHFLVNNKPWLVEHGPAAGSRLSGLGLRLFALQQDDDDDDVTITLFLDNGAEPLAQEVGGSLEHVIADLPPGEHQWRVSLNDGIDVLEFGPWEFMVNTPPALQLLGPDDGVILESPMEFRWKGSDFEEDALHYLLFLGDLADQSQVWEGRGTEVKLQLEEGEYFWYVVAEDSLDGTRSETRSFEVPPKLPPEPRIVSSWSVPVDFGSELTFRSEALDPDGELVLVEWFSDLDGSLSKALMFSTTTLSPGEHLITLTVSDDDKLSASQTINVTVLPPPLESPRAVLEMDRTTLSLGETLVFDLSASSDPDGSVRYYFVDFGDGQDSGWVRSSSLEHEYQGPGVYTASARVKDDDGVESEPERVSITVREKVKENDDSFGEQFRGPLGLGVLITLVFLAALAGLALRLRGGAEDDWGNEGWTEEEEQTDWENEDEDQEYQEEDWNDEGWEEGDGSS